MNNFEQINNLIFFILAVLLIIAFIKMFEHNPWKGRGLSVILILSLSLTGKPERLIIQNDKIIDTTYKYGSIVYVGSGSETYKIYYKNKNAFQSDTIK